MSNQVAVNGGYTSFTPLNFVWTFTGETFSSLGLNFGQIAVFGNNTLSVAQVPLPASVLLLLSAIGGLGALRLRTKQAA